MSRHLQTFIVIFFTAAVAVLTTGTASAQSTLRCESAKGRRVECRFEGAGTVQLSRQLGSNACIKGQSWGVDRNTIWVDQGCRADFAIAPIDDRNGNGWRRRENRTITVVCESKDGRRHRCAADTLGQITLGRQLSSDRCVEGRTWGTSSDGIWVDHGCRGEFSIADNGGTYRERGPSQAMQTLTCESDSPTRSYCRANNRFGVSLTREISRRKCVINQTWGSNRHGVWVSDGCRAEFALKTRS
jgi:hypothetical protein